MVAKKAGICHSERRQMKNLPNPDKPEPKTSEPPGAKVAKVNGVSRKAAKDAKKTFKSWF